MKRNKLTDTMMRAAAAKAVKDIRLDPDRGFKNLIDLGYKMAANDAQRDLVKAAEKELNNKNGAYYKLAEKIFLGTDQKVLTELGINLGLSALSDGAAQIRMNEETYRCKIPLVIYFDMSWGSYPALTKLDSLIKQGTATGICCYMLHIDRKYPDLPALTDIFAKYPDCVFMLFLYTPSINNKLLSTILSLKNTILFLKIEDNETEEFIQAARSLVQSGCLCGGFIRYSNKAAPPGDDSFLKTAYKLGLSVLCMMCNEKYRPAGGESMHRTVNNWRHDLKTPVFPIDVWEDIAELAENSSTGACLLTVSGSDQIIITDMEKRQNTGGISLDMPLNDIFRNYLHKF